jgi:hypothetical protein
MERFAIFTNPLCRLVVDLGTQDSRILNLPPFVFALPRRTETRSPLKADIHSFGVPRKKWTLTQKQYSSHYANYPGRL